MTKEIFNFDNSYLTLPCDFYVKNNPTPVAKPSLVLLNSELANQLGLDFSSYSTREMAELFSGNNIPANTEAFSQAYAGHQYGNFTILGDGRAHFLGEHISWDKKRRDVQLKGSGPTPFSRNGDGRAALGPVLREYLISEAMYGLGIPTTRCLAVVTTGETIRREKPLPSAVLTRTAISHLRIGTFEFAAAKNNTPLLAELFSYAVDRLYPDSKSSKNSAIQFLKHVMHAQIDLVVHWMRVGFIHGVMNTDNMSISGETIDYGPCAFMDSFDPNTVFSSIDYNGRYSFANQPAIAHWNLTRLAESLLPLADNNTKSFLIEAQKTLEEFSIIFHKKWLRMMRAKLGLRAEHSRDEKLIKDLLAWMKANSADYTNTYSYLQETNKKTRDIYHQKDFIEWKNRWRDRIKAEQEPIEYCFELMKQQNPIVIPRNHKVEQALVAAQNGCYTPLKNFIEAVRDPYHDNENLDTYKLPPKPDERVYQTFCGT